MGRPLAASTTCPRKECDLSPAFARSAANADTAAANRDNPTADALMVMNETPRRGGGFPPPAYFTAAIDFT